MLKRGLCVKSMLGRRFNKQDDIAILNTVLDALFLLCSGLAEQFGFGSGTVEEVCSN